MSLSQKLRRLADDIDRKLGASNVELENLVDAELAFAFWELWDSVPSKWKNVSKDTRGNRLNSALRGKREITDLKEEAKQIIWTWASKPDEFLLLSSQSSDDEAGTAPLDRIICAAQKVDINITIDGIRWRLLMIIFYHILKYFEAEEDGVIEILLRMKLISPRYRDIGSRHLKDWGLAGSKYCDLAISVSSSGYGVVIYMPELGRSSWEQKYIPGSDESAITRQILKPAGEMSEKPWKGLTSHDVVNAVVKSIVDMVTSTATSITIHWSPDARRKPAKPLVPKKASTRKKRKSGQNQDQTSQGCPPTTGQPDPNGTSNEEHSNHQSFDQPNELQSPIHSYGLATLGSSPSSADSSNSRQSPVDYNGTNAASHQHNLCPPGHESGVPEQSPSRSEPVPIPIQTGDNARKRLQAQEQHGPAASKRPRVACTFNHSGRGFSPASNYNDSHETSSSSPAGRSQDDSPMEQDRDIISDTGDGSPVQSTTDATEADHGSTATPQDNHDGANIPSDSRGVRCPERAEGAGQPADDTHPAHGHSFRTAQPRVYSAVPSNGRPNQSLQMMNGQAVNPAPGRTATSIDTGTPSSHLPAPPLQTTGYSLTSRGNVETAAGYGNYRITGTRGIPAGATIPQNGSGNMDTSGYGSSLPGPGYQATSNLGQHMPQATTPVAFRGTPNANNNESARYVPPPQQLADSREATAAREQYQSSRILPRSHQTSFDSGTGPRTQADSMRMLGTSVRTPGHPANEQLLQTAQPGYYPAGASNGRTSQSVQMTDGQGMNPGVASRQLPPLPTTPQAGGYFPGPTGNAASTAGYHNYQPGMGGIPPNANNNESARYLSLQPQNSLPIDSGQVEATLEEQFRVGCHRTENASLHPVRLTPAENLLNSAVGGVTNNSHGMHHGVPNAMMNQASTRLGEQYPTPATSQNWPVEPYNRPTQQDDLTASHQVPRESTTDQFFSLGTHADFINANSTDQHCSPIYPQEPLRLGAYADFIDVDLTQQPSLEQVLLLNEYADFINKNQMSMQPSQQ